MKKVILFLILYANIFPAYAITTEASKFVEECYAKKYECSKVHINVKKEYTTDYQLQTGEEKLRGITYGWGDMKMRKCVICRGKKYKVTYVVLLDKCKKPYWSNINFYQ